VRSTPGKGTGFSIEVPRGQPNVGKSVSAPAAKADSREFRGNLLVIEDEISVRTAINRLLRTSGIRVVLAATANEALALANAQDTQPDLILCDYNLRGSPNGVESIKALRAALGWNIPAIVMTGDTRLDTRTAITAHDISVLTKPFVANELFHLIERLRGNTQTRDR
jgi:CheY-like chemotaxis protein